MQGVLRMYSSLIVGVCYWLSVLDIFDVFCCDAVWGVLWIFLLERSIGFAISDWGMLNWNLGVCKVLFRPGYIICLFISRKFWFWLWCLALLRSCWRGGCLIYTGSFCGSLRDAWRITGSSGSDNRAWLSSNVYGLSWKEMRVDDWGLFVWLFVGVVGFDWDVVGGKLLGGCWLATLKNLKKKIYEEVLCLL